MLDVKRSQVWLDLYRSCYAIRAAGFTVRYERVALPCAGGAAEQPAKEMVALEVIDRVMNELLVEHLKRKKPKADEHE